jgi:hypothetical protein
VDIRRRAVLAIAELPGAEATSVLADALGDPDPAVRAPAALALGTRGATEAVPTLVGMVVAGTNDVEAGEVLGTLALDSTCADRILSALASELAAEAPGADPPGPGARRTTGNHGAGRPAEPGPRWRSGGRHRRLGLVGVVEER